MNSSDMGGIFLKKIRKFVAILLCSLFLFAASACQGTEPGQHDGVEEEVNAKQLPTVALVLDGPINDMEWNAYAYQGLMLIEERYGAKVSYSENVAQSDAESVFRDYAKAGYDLIFGHGAQFIDPIIAAASDYPDTQFCVINGTEVRDNVTNIEIAQNEMGFLMGAAAALLTETNTLGVVGGLEIPPISDAVEQFEVGAKYIEPDISVLSAMTGSFDDSGAAKETALAMIESGADVLGPIAGASGLGVVEACQEKNIKVVGDGKEQQRFAPQIVHASVETDMTILYEFVYDKFSNGNLEQTIYKMGVQEGAVYFTPFDEFDNLLSDEHQNILNGVVQDIKDGKVIVE